MISSSLVCILCLIIGMLVGYLFGDTIEEKLFNHNKNLFMKEEDNIDKN